MLSDKQKRNLRCKRKGTKLVGCRVGKNDDFKKNLKNHIFYLNQIFLCKEIIQVHPQDFWDTH